MAARHFKYTYNSEIPPKTVLSRMLRANIDNSYFDNNESNRMNMNIERNRIYFSRRKELKNFLSFCNTFLAAISRSKTICSHSIRRIY